ncbi:NYN domain-containing protein [Nakamurella flavida]|uniref:NYN domain-containing protein n=1 Tax=Nakamurella flavida TaxID=363630 RepID=A0A939BZV8_9ACTN|nr:NYN domain-containing protein [Nakamurella flavida]MBM9476083.1 NYN domain-containing protein [Nakamurella flavida]MDP9777172.1 hypothetical protein [Nakamurella flavida]
MTDADSQPLVEGEAESPARTGGLPEPVRARVVGWAAITVGTLPPSEVPAALRSVARFAPAKRARAGAAALARVLDGEPAFRAAVAAGAPAATAAPDGRRSGGRGVDDPVHRAALAFLLRSTELAEVLTEVRAAHPESDPAASTDALRDALARSRHQVDRLQLERDEALRGAAVGQESPEVARLRTRLREQGTRVRELQDALATAQAGARSDQAAVRAELDVARAEAAGAVERARDAEARAEQAQLSLARLREAGRERTAADGRRVELLLATAEGAVRGLRREWGITSGGADPADLVAATLPAPRAGTAPVDATRLTGWLTLPAAHLVVDGYNVTKTGYPALSLADQRDRLVRALSALSARTSAEITVVFDGAAVVAPAPPGRRIRVLFSPPGIPADDVIRDLVAGEPTGRVVVVVSSDKEVVERARRNGARTAPSPVLLDLLG